METATAAQTPISEVGPWGFIEALRDRAESLDPDGLNAVQVLSDTELELMTEPTLQDDLRAVAHARYVAARTHHEQVQRWLRQAERRLDVDTSIFFFIEACTAPR